MKMSMFRRALCLFIVIAMIVPVAASTATPLYTYPTVRFSLSDGITTNEMAYVDQFFSGSGIINNRGVRTGYLNDRGRALLKWLSNEARTDDDDRVNSGYLMLDQEVKENSESTWHLANEVAARFLGPAADYFASGGASVVVSLIEEGAYKLKFGLKGGERSYPYYVQLCQVFYEYMENLQVELEKTDEMLNAAADGIGEILETASDEIGFLTETDVLILFGTGSAKGLTYKVKDVDFDKEIMYVQSTGTKGSKTKAVHFSELDQNVLKNNSLIAYDLTGIENDGIRNNLKAALKKKAKTSKSGNEALCGMPYRYIEDTITSADDVPNVSKAEKEIINNLDSVKETNEIVLSKNLKKVDRIAKKLTIANDTIRAIKNTQNISTQQMAYMSALTNMSQEYLSMLEKWCEDIEGYSVPKGYEDVRNNILTAIHAVIEDVLDMQMAASEELADKAASSKAWATGFVYNAGEFADVLFDIAEFAGWKGIELINKATNFSSSDKINARISGVAGIASIALNVASADFLELENKSSAIYNLKWSLDELLRNEENGLLVQYAENRNHETACEIIDALNTMKILKIMGENLIEEYYLCDFYDSMDLEVTPAADLVIRNEMSNRPANDRLNASGSFVEIIGVCDEVVLYTKEAPDDYYPQDKIYYMGSVVRECYLKNASDYAMFDKVALTGLPSKYASLTTTKPATDRFHIRTDKTSIGENVSVTPGAVKTETKKLFLNKEVKLYSNNGLEIFLTAQDYDCYLTLEKEINRLLNKYSSVNDVFWSKWEQEDHKSSEEKKVETEQKHHERLNGTITTRKWIESFEMYDQNTNYAAS